MNLEPMFLSSLLGFTGGDFILTMIVNTIAIFIAAKVLDGIEIRNLKTALLVAIMVAILNATLGSYLTERTGLEIGILSFIIDGIVLLVASWFLEGFKIKGILWAFLLAVVLAFLNGFLFRFIGGI
ncbi:MAG: putative membrane protein [Saprospiraceae bacterium]|jgi:putative membrane protein